MENDHPPYGMGKNDLNISLLEICRKEQFN